MEGKITLRQAVVVEGKYDKIKLDALVDAPIISTGGFRIYKDKALQGLIRKLAHTCGLVVLTDGDAAGFRIRSHIRSIAQGGQVVDVYIPDIPGKERRKTAPGAEGKLGVEGMSLQVLREAFQKAGIDHQGDRADARSRLTKQDLYDAGLSGGPHSKLLRNQLYKRLELPEHLSPNSLLPLLSHMMSREELFSLAAALLEERR